MSWIILIVALLASILFGVMFLKQARTGLGETDLDDRFTWGLYVQGFFFFSALAGGILIFVAVAVLFELTALSDLADVGAAAAFGCLAAGGLMLNSDLGKPFRSLKIITGKNFSSPMTWDFITLSLLGLLNLVFLLGVIPKTGPLGAIWAVLCLIAALGFIMIHTLFFLSKVGAGFHSQPFLGLDTLVQSLWGGMALITLIALGMGLEPFIMVRLLIALTILVLMPLFGTYIANRSTKRKEFDGKTILILDVVILIILLGVQVSAAQSVFFPTVAALLVLVAVFLDKSHLIRHYQVKPNLPLPYSRYDDPPSYKPSTNEWLMAVGSLGVCVLVSTIIIQLQAL
jgi:Ni/Fe-hydrogenase subunit HybB-like protein